MGMLEIDDECLLTRHVADEDCDECCSSACASAQCCDDDACSDVSIIDCDCPSQGVQQQSQISCRQIESRCCSEVSDCEQVCLPCDDDSCQNDTANYICCTNTTSLPPPNTTLASQNYDSFYDTNGFHFDQFSVPDLSGLARSPGAISGHQCSGNFSSSTSTTALLDSSAVSMVSSVAEPSEPYHCHWQDCDSTFINVGQFDQHFMAQHLKPFQAPVPINTPLQASYSSLPLMCNWDDCHVAPTDVPSLFDHVKHDHVEVEEHHRCKWLVADNYGNVAPCGLCVGTVEELTKHISEDHIGWRQKEYVCYWQDCDRCSRPFAQRQKIVRHIVVHTGDKPYRCGICGYTCSEEAVLKQHKRTHTGEKPYQCTVCHKSFSASTALSVHMRTHTGFKPLTCKFPGCGKRFSESSNLAKHMRIHSENKSFRCSYFGCGKSFQRPDQLKRHLRSVHKELDTPPCSHEVTPSRHPVGLSLAQQIPT